MADDIGSRGEDPRDVARRRLNIGRRLREGQVRTAQGQASGPSMTPSTQSMVPYREGVPAGGGRGGGGEGGRGGPPATSGGREMAAPRGENLPAVRREGMPSIRVPPGSAEAMRGAMQSPMARAAGTGRAAAGRAAVEGAMRLGDRLMRGGRSPAARMPSPDLGDEAPEPARSPRPYPFEEEDMYAGSVAGRPAPAPRPRQAARAAPREMSADDLNEIVLRLNRGEKPVTETEKRLADRMGIAYRKGGMVKPKTAMKKGGAVKAPAKKMKSGGKVAPKKMMKGGMTSKPKKMMGGGRAMYAKGGMAKGCK